MLSLSFSAYSQHARGRGQEAVGSLTLLFLLPSPSLSLCHSSLCLCFCISVSLFLSVSLSLPFPPHLPFPISQSGHRHRELHSQPVTARPAPRAAHSTGPLLPPPCPQPTHFWAQTALGLHPHQLSFLGTCTNRVHLLQELM
jgi:hypothetical protein